jgi:hypothetical protein
VGIPTPAPDFASLNPGYLLKSFSVRRVCGRLWHALNGRAISLMPPSAMNLEAITSALERFSGTTLTATLARIEADLKGSTNQTCPGTLASLGVGRETLSAAAELKRIAGQVNTTIHALGILLCLPHILEAGEVIEYVSLGAGNTGREFDLETNYRIAEFKFIRWRGKAETIRQNNIFKDFFELAESGSTKRKYLYVLDTKFPLKFFNARRALTSVLSKNEAVRDRFRDKFGTQYKRVHEYLAHSGKVTLVDTSPWLPELISKALQADETSL